MPVEIFHLKVAYRPGLGHAHGLRAARSSRRRARAAWTSPPTSTSTPPAAPASRRRSRAGRHEGGTRLAASRGSRDPDVRARLKRELATGSPGWWNIVEAAGGWDGRRARERAATRPTRGTRRQVARRDREGDWGRIPPTPRGTSSPQGDGRVMAIYHMMGEADIETALALPVDEHRQRRRRRREGRQPGRRLGLPHPRSLRQRRARHRAVREGAPRARRSRRPCGR